MSVRRKLVTSLCVATVLATGLGGVTASPAAAEARNREMWTEDQLPRGGSVQFYPENDSVYLCDEDPGDGHGVWLRVARRRDGKTRYILRYPDQIGCRHRDASWGGRYNLPEGKKWYFRICLTHDGNKSACDDNRGDRWRS